MTRRAAIALAALSAVIAGSFAAAQPRTAPWRDTRLPPDRRAALLAAALTPDERIALLWGVMALPFQDYPVPAPAIPAAGYVPGVPRLGIPALFETDAALGVANPQRVRPDDGATALPAGTAIAATFDPALAFAGGRMIGAEARAQGFNVLLGGSVDLVRDPRGGRTFEYLGEDPLLAGIMAGEAVRGVQSNHIISTVKQFALNDQETNRHYANAVIDEGALRESDLLAFQIAIERGRPGAVMCAYNLVNGEPTCASDFLLNRVLKRDWRFPGWVMSDWATIESPLYANKGVDQQSGAQLDDRIWFDAPLREAVRTGAVPPARIADMNRRILTGMIATGLFDHPVARGGAVDEAAHLAVARRIATRGIVLLRNERNLLPLSPTIRRILVVGGRADIGVLSGGGSSQVIARGAPARSFVHLGGTSGVGGGRVMHFHGRASPVEAIRARAPGAAVSYDDGRYPAAAARRARQADLVIVFANQWMSEDEDVPDLSLPDGQDALVAAVAAANPHTVVVLQTGGAVAMPWLSSVPAVLEAWYSGAGGADAIADVLFGRADPAGRLPITFPAAVDQLPRPVIPGTGLPLGTRFDSVHHEGADVGYRWFARRRLRPLFAFGHGLSYTTFRFSRLTVRGGPSAEAEVDATNVGDRAGVAVPQLYLTASPDGATQRLVGFAAATLAPGETRRLRFRIDPRLLARFDVARNRWVRPPGRYTIAIGSAADALTGSVGVTLAARSDPA